MLNLYPRLDVGSPGDDDNRICYGVVVACVSLLLFCVLVASVNVAKACAITVAVVVFFAVVGWLAPGRGLAARDGSGVSGRRDAPPATVELRRCACGLADAALPAFAYGDGGKRGSCVLCAVCLEDVQGGEMVRQLPACRHLFHVECIDAWLRSHRTCPLCRCELPPPQRATAKTSPAAAVESSSAEALPPV